MFLYTFPSLSSAISLERGYKPYPITFPKNWSCVPIKFPWSIFQLIPQSQRLFCAMLPWILNDMRYSTLFSAQQAAVGAKQWPHSFLFSILSATPALFEHDQLEGLEHLSAVSVFNMNRGEIHISEFHTDSAGYIEHRWTSKWYSHQRPQQEFRRDYVNRCVIFIAYRTACYEFAILPSN